MGVKYVFSCMRSNDLAYCSQTVDYDIMIMKTLFDMLY